MDLQYYGGNCVTLANKRVRLIFDDNLVALGLKSITKADDVGIFTAPHGKTTTQPRLLIDGPGEYEVSGLSVVGIAARAHMDPEDTNNATMYKIVTDEASYLITGHIYPELSDKQLEKIGMVDVVVIPVGGNGYTLDAVGALHLIKQIEPKVVVPTHYTQAGVTYPVEQQPLDQALKNLGMEAKETVSKLHFKPLEITDATQLVLLERC